MRPRARLTLAGSARRSTRCGGLALLDSTARGASPALDAAVDGLGVLAPRCGAGRGAWLSVTGWCHVARRDQPSPTFRGLRSRAHVVEAPCLARNVYGAALLDRSSAENSGAAREELGRKSFSGVGRPPGGCFCSAGAVALERAFHARRELLGGAPRRRFVGSKRGIVDTRRRELMIKNSRWRKSRSATR